MDRDETSFSKKNVHNTLESYGKRISHIRWTRDRIIVFMRGTAFYPGSIIDHLGQILVIYVRGGHDRRAACVESVGNSFVDNLDKYRLDWGPDPGHPATACWIWECSDIY